MRLRNRTDSELVRQSDMYGRPLLPEDLADQELMLNLKRVIDSFEGSYKLGIKIANAVTARVAAGEALTHAVIMDGRQVGVGSSKQVEVTPNKTNTALFKKFDIETIGDEPALTSGEVYYSRMLDKMISLEPVFDPAEELYPEEVEGLRNRLRARDGSKLEGGFVVLPQTAVRAVVVGHEPAYLK